MKYSGTNIKIRDVQKIELEILLEFDRICKKNNITYQLFAGTLLGAIRHKGFIPWDDDIDVCMLRKDYEKFIDCCKKDLDSKYFLQDRNSDKNTILQFAKIRKNNTIFINHMEKDSGMHHGIYIDIFPLDNVKLNSLFGLLQPKLFNMLYMVSISRLENRAKNTKNLFNKVVRLAFYYLFKLIPKSLIDKPMQSILRIYENVETKYVNHLTNGASKERLKKYLREKESFYNIMEAEFEGHLFPIPMDYHDVLTKNYGDYMKLPPEEKRHPHHGIFEVKI